MSNKKSILWFLRMAFAISWVLFLIPLAFKSDPIVYSQTALIFWAAAMWGPGIAALVVTLFVEKKPFGSLRLNRFGKFRYYLAAWFLPPILAALTILASILLKTAQYDPNMTTMNELLAQSAKSEAAAIPVTLVVVLQIVQGLLFGPAINAFFTMGEELGWRGFLLPRMMPMGQWKALILGGIIWGVWHAPAILQGHNYPEHPILGVFLMIAFCVLLSIIIGWMYLNVRSPWVAAIAHGSINAWAGLPVIFLLPGFDSTYGGTLASVSGMVVLALLVGLLILSKALPVKEIEEIAEEK